MKLIWVSNMSADTLSLHAYQFEDVAEEIRTGAKQEFELGNITKDCLDYLNELARSFVLDGEVIHAIDLLLSSDIGEDSFNKALNEISERFENR